MGQPLSKAYRSKGGNFTPPDGTVVTVSDSRTGIQDYGGRGKGKPTPALFMTWTDDMGNAYPDVALTAGATSVCSPDGTGFENMLPENSNATLFLDTLEDAGFPRAVLDGGDVRVLDGLVGRVESRRVEAKDNLNAYSVPLITEIVQLPGDAPAAPPTAPRPPAAATAPRGVRPPATPQGRR